MGYDAYTLIKNLAKLSGLFVTAQKPLVILRRILPKDLRSRILRFAQDDAPESLRFFGIWILEFLNAEKS